MIQNAIDGFTKWYLDLGTRLRVEKEGATAVEYGLIVAGIAAVIIVAVNLLGTNTNDAFGTVNDNFGSTATP
jgi:pilus assembly protein Flp/PilA